MTRIIAAACVVAGAALLAAAPAPVMLLTLDGAVGPATADYAVRGIRKASDAGAALVVLRMDTPGGLDTSMRQVIKEILAAPLPVAVFVSPSGARAASAGTYILYASHIAAMAPGTNLGAATPIQMGGLPGTPQQKDEKKSNEPTAAERKSINDVEALLRSLAQLRGRDLDFAGKAVREAATLTADEARTPEAERIKRSFFLVTGGRKRLIDKTPRNALRVGFIEALFPDAHYVFLKRDGRDNINSLINAWRTPRYRTYEVPGGHRIPGVDPRWWKFTLYPGWRDDVDVPLEVLQELAGHRDLSRTQRYMHLSPAAIETRLNCWIRWWGRLKSASTCEYVETPKW